MRALQPQSGQVLLVPAPVAAAGIVVHPQEIVGRCDEPLRHIVENQRRYVADNLDIAVQIDDVLVDRRQNVVDREASKRGTGHVRSRKAAAGQAVEEAGVQGHEDDAERRELVFDRAGKPIVDPDHQHEDVGRGGHVRLADNLAGGKQGRSKKAWVRHEDDRPVLRSERCRAGDDFGHDGNRTGCHRAAASDDVAKGGTEGSQTSEARGNALLLPPCG